MKKLVILMILFIVILTGCKKIIQQGINPEKLDNNIPYIHDSVYFKDEQLELKFVTVQNYVRQDTDDLIIYLHGIYRTELEWAEANGFGRMFYDVIKENPELPSYTVVSISFGGAFLLIDQAPPPFNADLESMFLNKIIPYFKNRYAKAGNVYLIGHSLGGFNSLTVSLRHPDKIKAITVISPYVAPISPFSPEFEQKGIELKMPEMQIKMLKKMLTEAFKTEDKWFQYNPFRLIETGQTFPYIAISDARNDLPGFEWSIDNFNEELNKRNIDHFFCKSPGDHRTTCKKIFYNFLEKISTLK